MTTRDQLNYETLMALIDLLENTGTITETEAHALRDRRDLEHAQEARRAFRTGRGPPDWAGGTGKGGGPS
jgi:hypothetical protein